jgi:hypothetical protein
MHAKTHANPDPSLPLRAGSDGNSLYHRAVRLSKNLSCLLITMGLVILEKAVDLVS